MFNLASRVLALVFMTILVGCTSLTDLKTDVSERVFGRDPTENLEPLADIKATIKPKVLWNVKLGETEDYDFTPAARDGFAYAASASGEIVKVDLVKGTQIWRVNAGEKLSGGVGLGPNLVLVGTPKGQVIAYDQSGKLLWKAKVSSEVLSVPHYETETIVVRCGDSRIFGINAADGARKWVYERSNPTLMLRSSAGVVVDSGAAYAGFAGGKLVAIRVEDGKTIWEVSVAQPKGTTEIERIADITSLPVVDGPLVYAVAYQGKVAAFDRVSGKNVWNRDISSYTGINIETTRLYVSHATGSVYSLDYSNGKTYWRQAALKGRNLSAPLPMISYVAVGDIEGYLHVLDREDGSFSGRIKLDDSSVEPQMAAFSTTGLLAQTRKGGLYAVSIK